MTTILAACIIGMAIVAEHQSGDMQHVLFWVLAIAAIALALVVLILRRE